jgi:hypothetical protein
MEDIAFSELNIMSFPLFQNSKPNPPIPGRSGLFCSVDLKIVAAFLCSCFCTYFLVLLHNGGFCNTCTPKRYLHISEHF